MSVLSLCALKQNVNAPSYWPKRAANQSKCEVKATRGEMKFTP